MCAWFRFSTDQAALDLSEQFMWGAGLLISPIVYPVG